MRGTWQARAIMVAAMATATALAACTALTGLSALTVDEAPADPDANPSTITSTEASTDAGPTIGNVDAEVVDGCGTSDCEVIPDGFELVALSAGGPSSPLPPQPAACPMGFGQPFDGVEATVNAGACSCGCNVTQQPSCQVDAGLSLTLLFDQPNTNTCASAGQPVPTGCSTAGYLGPFISYDRKYVAPPSTLRGGACNALAAKDDTKLKTSAARICQATVIPQCEGKTCIPNVAPLTACIAANGAVACPSNWPTRHLVGASASFSCGPGCTCNLTGTCGTAGSLKYFASADCSGAAGLTYPVNGACNLTAAASTTFASHRYDPNGPSNVNCQTGGASTATTPTLTQETTVCCR